MEEEVEFDREDHLELIEALLIPEETLHAVYECHGVATGFVGLTDRRLILYLPTFLGIRAKTLVSVPYHQIASVGWVVEERGLMAPSKIVTHTTAGEHYDVALRPEEKTRRAYTLIMTHVLEWAE